MINTNKIANTIGQERNKLWRELAHTLSGFDSLLIAYVQGLGLIDSELLEFETKRSSMKNTPNDNLRWITLSQLWIFGVYEIIRTIAQHLGDFTYLTKEDQLEVIALKKEFAKIRIPLAKFEKQGASKKESAMIRPYTDEGFGWKVEDELIIRKSLSDKFLLFLHRISKK